MDNRQQPIPHPHEYDQKIETSSNSSKNLSNNEKHREIKNHRHQLKSYNELPGYMKDSEFIHNYYRVEWPFKKALFSLFLWHNETVNIWTHLLGFALFVWLTVVNATHVSQAVHLFGIFRFSSYKMPQTKYTSHDSSQLFMGMTNLVHDMKQITSPTGSDQAINHLASWPLYIYLSGSMLCFLSSTICHLFCCHSKPINLWLLLFDYTGITTMIITSFFPPIYCIFQCQPLCQILYLTGISLFGTFTIVTLLSPTFSSGKFRAFRAILFVSMGLFGLVPAIHGCVLNWTNPRQNLTLAYESTMGLSYLIGTGFYVSRVPERWRPGWFDLVGHSLQFIPHRDRLLCKPGLLLSCSSGSTPLADDNIAVHT